MNHLYWLVPAIAVAIVFFVWIYARKSSGAPSPAELRSLFDGQRKQLEEQFFHAASQSGKPRGLRWKECQWSELFAWVREKGSGQLLALVGVTISFEAIEGGDMEGVEAVGNLRNASAVFFFQDGQWQTAGRTIFNLNPDEVLTRFAQGYERVEM